MLSWIFDFTSHPSSSADFQSDYNLLFVSGRAKQTVSCWENLFDKHRERERAKKGEASGAQIPRNGKCEVTPGGEGREKNLIKTEANTNNMFDIKTKLS